MGVVGRTLVLVGAVIGAAVVWPATGEAGTAEPVTLTVTKEVTGPGDVTGSIVVQVDCVDASGGGPTTQTIDFGDSSGTRDIEVTQSQPTCTVTEPGRGGAVGTDFRPTLPFDDQCQYTPTVDSMTVSWGGAESCPVTIVNVYEAGDPAPPTSPPSSPPTASPAAVSQAAPAFTG